MEVIISVILLLVVLVVLVVVHEFGHLVVAKMSRMRVDEFGIGFPPRALTFARFGGTNYTLNWLPFGGFVSMPGENGTQDPNATDEFSAKPLILQVFVLVAGIAMNLIFAYVVLTAVLVMGTQQALSPEQVAKVPDAKIVFAEIVPDSPAAKAGFMPGDEIESATIVRGAIGVGYSQNNPLGLATLISTDTDGSPMVFSVNRSGKHLTLTATPQKGIVSGDPNRAGLGVTLTAIGTVKTSLMQAPIDGLAYTWNFTEQTAIGLFNFLKGIVMLKPDLSQVAGPIGIAKDLGQASAGGLATFLIFTAAISISLALVNVLPFPALDGGRLLFVIIEAVTGKKIPPQIAGRINTIGFALLMLLIVAVSIHDILHLSG